jgi:hypothetical protein
MSPTSWTPWTVSVRSRTRRAAPALVWVFLLNVMVAACLTVAHRVQRFVARFLDPRVAFPHACSAHYFAGAAKPGRTMAIARAVMAVGAAATADVPAEQAAALAHVMTACATQTEVMACLMQTDERASGIYTVRACPADMLGAGAYPMITSTDSGDERTAKVNRVQAMAAVRAAHAWTTAVLPMVVIIMTTADPCRAVMLAQTMDVTPVIIQPFPAARLDVPDLIDKGVVRADHRPDVVTDASLCRMLPHSVAYALFEAVAQAGQHFLILEDNVLLRRGAFESTTAAVLRRLVQQLRLTRTQAGSHTEVDVLTLSGQATVRVGAARPPTAAPPPPFSVDGAPGAGATAAHRLLSVEDAEDFFDMGAYVVTARGIRRLQQAFPLHDRPFAAAAARLAGGSTPAVQMLAVVPRLFTTPAAATVGGRSVLVPRDAPTAFAAADGLAELANGQSVWMAAGDSDGATCCTRVKDHLARSSSR